MKKHLRRCLILPTIGLISIVLLHAPPTKTPYLITFSTGNIQVGTVFTAQLDLRLSVGVAPSLILSGTSGSLDVTVFSESATMSMTYEESTYSKNFTTPIGSLKTPIHQVAIGMIYANVTGTMKATPQIKGDASISPTTLNWASNGSQNFSVAHRASLFSIFLPDSITVELLFQYDLNITIGIEALGDTVFEYTANAGSLIGSRKVTQDLSTIPIGTIFIIVVAVAVMIRFVREKRKKKKAKAQLAQ